MGLVDKAWKRTSLHRVVLAWLRSERHSGRAGAAWPNDPSTLERILDHPDLSDPDENRVRLRLLYVSRMPLLVEIPPDTTWYEVRSLTDDELDELHVIYATDWIRTEGESALRKVCEWKKVPLVRPVSEWQPPILFGHVRNGPFTILEANHRLTAYAGSGARGLDIPVFVGLSPLGCRWHGPSTRQRSLLMRDLIWPPRSMAGQSKPTVESAAS